MTNDISIHDHAKLTRCRQAPARGPATLFFSGGTALRQVSRRLIQTTHNSVHIVTPFDSGGSSAELRKAFHMPAVGDLRNRLAALMDTRIKGIPELSRLVTSRLPRDKPGSEALQELEAILSGSHVLVRELAEPARQAVLQHLSLFNRRRPADFDLRGASLGNLILTGAYLELGRRLEPALRFYSEMAAVRGSVHPVLDDSLHLAARLENGQTVFGQHRLTGKEAPPIQSPIVDLVLNAAEDRDSPVQRAISADLQDDIARADLICFPMGSFFTSLMATLLPAGLGRAVARASCLKIYVPSTGCDPETFGLSLAGQIERLTRQLLADCPEGTAAGDVLDLVVLDRDRSHYSGDLSEAWLSEMGLRKVDCELVTPWSHPLIDPDRLIEVLISLAA